MKLACVCGEVMIDQTDGLPYKADVLPDEEAFAFMDRMRALLDNILSSESPKDAERSGMAHIQIIPARTKLQQELNLFLGTAFRSVYQCPKCGRLNLASPDGQDSYFFSPDDPATPHDLLSGNDRT